MTEAASGGAALEVARRMLDGAAPPPAGLAVDEYLALGWALKDLCYSAWNSDPPRAASAASALRALSAGEGHRAVGHAAQREVRALAEWTSGIAHLTEARMAEAISALDRAAELFTELGQVHHASETQVAKIVALTMLGEHAQAAACAERTQREFVALGDSRAAGKVSLNLGSLHLRRDAYAEAARHYRDAVVLFARVGDREHSVMADIGMADALTAFGDIAESRRIYSRAASRAQAHGFPVLEALVEESVALLDLAQGRYREALAGFESSRSRYEALAMPQHLAIAEKQLADTYLEVRLLPEALRLFDRALAQFQTLAMPDDAAWTLAQRGRTLAMLQQSEAAAESFARAASMFSRQQNAVGESAVAMARAEIELNRGDVESARRLSRAAADGFGANGFVDGVARAQIVHAHALLADGAFGDARALFELELARSRQLRLTAIEVRALTGIGLTARAAGDDAAADTAFRGAIDLFEEQRRALPGDEIRSAFLTDQLRPYRELMQMMLDAHERSPSPGGAEGIMQHLDRLRARGLGERLAMPERDDGDATAGDLRARLSWLYRRVQRMQQEGNSSQALTAELRATEGELLERARRRRLASTADDVHTPAEQPLAVDALRASLRDRDALVEYGVRGDELFACVATRGGVSVHRRIAAWSDVEAAVQSARFQIETLRHGVAPVERHLARLVERAQLRLQRLHALLWEPLASILSDKKRVLIVPHGAMGGLPFAALYDGASYVAQRYEVAVVPSARVALHGFARELGPIRRAIALGESTHLPWAAAEARQVASLFPEGEACVGPHATLDALRKRAGDADVVHLACHAQFRTDNPMFSALHLYDGALTVEIAERLSLKAGIVVLSGCETALAEAGAGDEMVGLVRAFLIAGTARVLASLWPVDDEVTSRFMSHFYGALRDGKSPASALNEGQLQVMRYNPHPFYWSAFVLQGGW